MVTIDQLRDQLKEALSGPKPRYAALKQSLAEISGLPADFINPKNISSHNQVSPRASESFKNRFIKDTPDWMFVGLLTVPKPAQPVIVDALKTEIKRFATVAVFFGNDPQWDLISVMAAEGHETTAQKLAAFFGSTLKTEDIYPAPMAAAKKAKTTVPPPDDLFISDEEFDSIVTSLREKKNMVLQGPPGVGKSFVARRVAKQIAGESGVIHIIQFHQSYGYEDFIQGWRPKKKGSFDIFDGTFVRFCEEAKKNTKLNFVIVIDEINRGNLPKIFGEVMTLIESDKRSSEYEMELMYSYPDRKCVFSVPPNVHIIGTMNTADRSLAFVDYALRRRFVFEYLKPAFGSELFEDYLIEQGVEADIIDLINTRIPELNEQIADDTRNLGEGFEIGHSFFCPLAKGAYGREWYETIIRKEIGPLIKEYWSGNSERANKCIEELMK